MLKNNFNYLEPDSDWLYRDKLDMSLFYSDGIHLIKKGNEKFSKAIHSAITKLYNNKNPATTSSRPLKTHNKITMQRKSLEINTCDYVHHPPEPLETITTHNTINKPKNMKKKLKNNNISKTKVEKKKPTRSNTVCQETQAKKTVQPKIPNCTRHKKSPFIFLNSLFIMFLLLPIYCSIPMFENFKIAFVNNNFVNNNLFLSLYTHKTTTPFCNQTHGHLDQDLGITNLSLKLDNKYGSLFILENYLVFSFFFIINFLKVIYSRKRNIVLVTAACLFQIAIMTCLLQNSDINSSHTKLQNCSWEVFSQKGFHMVHLNINSLLPKIDELRAIASSTKASIIGITESKIDKSVTDSEISIDGYNLLRCDRNRRGGGVVCYIKNNICYNNHSKLPTNVEGIIFDILIPKTKSFTVGIFYRPPNQTDFIENISKEFSNIDFCEKECYLLGDFNINTLCNNKNIFKMNKSALKSDQVSTLQKQYVELCSLYGLKQLIDEPTRITCSTASIIDHLLSNCEKKISQCGVLDISLSDHQMIFCTRKTKKIKNNTHKEIKF